MKPIKKEDAAPTTPVKEREREQQPVMEKERDENLVPKDDNQSPREAIPGEPRKEDDRPEVYEEE